ncbi:type II secretion system protein [Luteolibacter marinus]|uniref:type II secretion system protein n=1 Tax=Luteolibacter marinus TaxID=2776705 RepID=UPI001865F1BF|nr:type II secretion system protein [Luteolibacter marinus]
MNARYFSKSTSRGFTLIEMSLVIFVLITLMTTGFYSSSVIGDWKKAREGSETLRTVYVAQRTFLADSPTTAVTSITPAMLLPYLPNGLTTFPTAKALDGTRLYVRVNVSPPYLTATSGGTGGTKYDPSASPTDSLWDVGE